MHDLIFVSYNLGPFVSCQLRQFSFVINNILQDPQIAQHVLLDGVLGFSFGWLLRFIEES